MMNATEDLGVPYLEVSECHRRFVHHMAVICDQDPAIVMRECSR
jgi:hypothetical protein